MTVFYTPVASAFGQNIDASPGSKLFFFEPGTTTPKTTFSDAAETVPNTDPVIADARGRFIPIFLTGVYDVELQDANGVQIWKALRISTSGITGNVAFLGGFDSSTNAGDYPATGSKGDLFIVTTGFTLNPASGSHVLNTGDFIIASKDSATGIDADWDIIRGVEGASLSDVSVQPWSPTRAYSIGDYVEATDFKLYRALVAQTGNDPAGGGDPTNWLPFGDLVNNVVTDDPTRGLTAAQGKILKGLIDNPPGATTAVKGVDLLFRRIILSNGTDVDHDIDFSAGYFSFSDGSGSARNPSQKTKQLDNTWVVGNDAGGLADALTIAIDTWYHCFALSRADGVTTDFGFDTDIDATNLLADTNVIAAGITKAQDVGSRRTDASANLLPTFQIGKRVYFETRIVDVDVNGNIGLVAVLPTMTLPLDKETIGIINIGYEETTNQNLLITSPEEVDFPPVASGTTWTIQGIGTGLRASNQIEVKTNLLSQIRYRVSEAVVNRVVFSTLGWIDKNLEN